MAKKDAEFRALLSEDNNVTRGRIPAPFVKALGGKAGDYMVFKIEGGKVSVSISKAKAAKATKATKTAAKPAATKTAAKPAAKKAVKKR